MNDLMLFFHCAWCTGSEDAWSRWYWRRWLKWFGVRWTGGMCRQCLWWSQEVIRLQKQIATLGEQINYQRGFLHEHA